MDKTNKVLQKDHPEMESALDSRRWDYVARALPFLVCLACFTDWSSLVVKIYNSYNEMLANGDHRLADWPLMSSPIPTFILTGAYLYFVKIAGPRWMENREPFDLRKFMIVYNFTLVTLSFWLFVEMGKLIEWGRYSFQCQVVDYSDNPIAMRMVLIGWYFYLTKFVEFIDTIIFVLRKKNSQISTLHVFHHSVVPITLWVGIKFASGGNNAWFPFLNSGVHTIMYMYYGLAAFGPKMQKYLWWKKYLTKLQLTQFTLALAHGLRALFQDCDFPRSFIFLNLFHAILFFYLFYSFYQKSYKDKSERSTSRQRVGLSVSASSGPAGASTRTFARFGDVTITASVHYHNGTQESSECHFKSSNISSSPPVDKEALVN